MKTIHDIRPRAETAAAYRSQGVWRDLTALDDLQRWLEETPDSTAIFAHRAGADPLRVTYAQFAGAVERFAAGLAELGVGPGQVVAIQLPNWWQTSALMLACIRVGAVMAPIMTTIRARELERVLVRLEVTVCVTTDRWDGYEHAAALSEMSSRLPDLKHRVVLGEKIADDEVDFVTHFENTAWEERHPMPLALADEDPDRPVLVLFTSGTSGEPKGVLHSFNTLYASCSAVVPLERIGPGETVFIPLPLTHIFGTLCGMLMPLFGGAAWVLLDVWSPESALAIMTDARVTIFEASPAFVSALVAAAADGPVDLPDLRFMVCGGATIPAKLVADVDRVFGVTLRALWGMTECSWSTWTRVDDPADEALRSDGRPVPGVELDLRAESEISRERPARLFIRGAGLGLATLGRDGGELRVLAEHDDGWYDTGDLAIPDGRGGIRVVGRDADRIGGGWIIPVNDVESELLAHPAVADVALVGYLDDDGFELACAVIVPVAAPPTLAELRTYLDSRGMTGWYQPSRVEIVAELPRNASRKVLKEQLRRWLREN